MKYKEITKETQLRRNSYYVPFQRLVMDLMEANSASFRP